jgi:hypothetical protein
MNIKITWYPYGDNPQLIRHEGGTVFEHEATCPSSSIKWKLHVFDGAIRCTPPTTQSPSIVATFTLYTPARKTNPNAPAGYIDMRPEQVGIVAGSHMRLSSGHAVVVTCGAGSLHVSRDYPEYEHPKDPK